VKSGTWVQAQCSVSLDYLVVAGGGGGGPAEMVEEEVEQEVIEHLFQVELSNSFLLFRWKYSSNSWSWRSRCNCNCKWKWKSINIFNNYISTGGGAGGSAYPTGTGGMEDQVQEEQDVVEHLHRNNQGSGNTPPVSPPQGNPGGSGIA
jgi:hypothetical protein